MAKLRVALKTWTADKDGKHLVLLGIEAGNRTKYVSLGIKVRKTQWSKKNKRVLVSTHPHAKALNAEIEKKLSEAIGILNKMKYEEVSLTVDSIKEAITGGDKRDDFWAYADTWLEQKRRKGQVYYWRRCRSVLRKFKEFAGSPLAWNQITVTRLKEFDLFLDETKKNSANTRRGAFRVIRTVVREAVRESVIDPTGDPFYRFVLPKAEQPQRVRLSLDEIERIDALDLSDSRPDCTARDMYILAFKMRGARFGDVARLKWSSIVYGRIIYVAGKTGDPVSVPISSGMKEILDRYNDGQEESEFIFPPLRNHQFPNAEKEAAYVGSVNAWVNRSLKSVAEKAGVNKSVSFHSARHSFASAADKMGIDHATIQAALKHKTRQTTDVYLKSLDDTSLDEKLKTVYRND